MKQNVKGSLRLNPTMVTCILSMSLAAGVQAVDIHLRGLEPPAPASYRLDDTVMDRTKDELQISINAKLQALNSAKAARSQQDSYASHITVAAAQAKYDKISPLVPETRAGSLKVKQFAMLARNHADHVTKVESEMMHIPQLAAEKAKEAVAGWIASEAAKNAEDTHLSPKEAAKVRVDKLAAAVAGAAEPYHLALLRNQKFAQETLNKAKTAQQSAVSLQTKAKQMTATAIQMQTAGAGLDAQTLMGTAHGLMNEAENLRQWGNKLYKQANTADASTGAYVAEEQQAATNAAMTTIINAPMKLP